MKSDHATTRSPRFSLWLASLATAGLLPLGASSLCAQTTATWNGGTGNWSNGSFWSTNTAPNGAAYDVYIDGGKTATASVVSLDGNYTFGRLTLDTGDTVNVVNDVVFTVSNGAFSGSGSIINNGTINFNSTGGGIDLHFNGAGTISGAGTINFNGANNHVFANTAGDTVTIGAGQTLAGQVNLGYGSTNFINQGSVTANQNGNTLTLQPGNGYTFTNSGSGIARAENGGVLELSPGTFTGNGFTALAGSRVQVDGGTTVANATLSSVGTGTVTMDSATLTNATLAGSVAANNDATVTLNGTLTNTGTFTLNSTGGGIDLVWGGPTTISGTGTINLTGGNNHIYANHSGDLLTIGAGQTVAGTGNLGYGSTNFTNQGTVTANQNGNTLTLQPGNGYTFTNSGSGIARAENGGVLTLSSGTFSGGTFTALTGSRVQVNSGATVSGATLASSGTGTVTMDSATLTNATLAGSVAANNDATVTLNGTLTNTGTFTLNSTGGGIDLVLGGPTTISGTGTINLTGGNNHIYANHSGDLLTIGTGQSITGVGNLGYGSTTINSTGNIAANVNGGTLTIQPSGGTGTFVNQVGGTVAASNGGTMVLINASGGTFTNQGNFTVGANSTFSIAPGALTNFSGTTLSGGSYFVSAASATAPATLYFSGGSIVTSNAFVSLDGPGAVFNEINALANNASGGSFTVSNGFNFTTAGALTNAGSVLASNSTLTVSGTLTNSGQALTANSGTIAVQGNTTNSGLIRTQGGTFAVQGTLNSSGVLQTSLGGTGGTISSTGALTQTSAGTLLGSGSATAPTLALAGSLRPGDDRSATTGTISAAVGALTLNGQVGLVSGTTLLYDLAGTAASDQIKVNGALTLDGTLNVNAVAGFGAGRYDLIDYTGTLTNNTLDLGTLPSGYNYRIDTSMAGQVDLVVTSAVPEPSTWLGGLLSLGLMAFLRRRSRA